MQGLHQSTNICDPGDPMNSDPLVRLEEVKKYFPIGGSFFRRNTAHVRAVDCVTLSISKGETLGLVGESGCGKTTLGRLILQIETLTDGKIYIEGKNIVTADRNEMRLLRRQMQIIFQDPYSSLNPRKTVAEIIGAPLVIQNIVRTRRERDEKVLELIMEVGLRSEHLYNYPHEFSGGQRQRIGIARALALKPKLIVCDEPVSALDVSVQAQVVNLLQDLQERFGLTYLFISHDLAVVEQISNRVAVMYLGRIVELAFSETIYQDPKHPYTKALISASPIPDPQVKKTPIVLEGDVPSPINPPEGCHFHPRCVKAFDSCKKGVPELIEVAKGHYVRCFLYL